MNFSTIWRNTLDRVIANGRMREVRGFKTQELLNLTLDMRFDVIDQALCLLVNRKANLAFNVAEALYILLGRNDVPFIAHYNKNITQFANGATFLGAYGRRMDLGEPGLITQLDLLIDRYHADPYSRQMFLQISDAIIDMMPDNNDRACNQLVNFIVDPKEGALQMTVHSRSCDVVWGLTYDVFNFTCLHEQIAQLLKRQRGRFIYHIQSAHVYERHWKKLRKENWGAGKTAFPSL